MPYLSDPQRRKALIPAEVPKTKGELNYAISMLMQVYFVHRIAEDGRISYDNLSDAASACHEAEQEWRRRMIVPYENKKVEEHGDVYFPVVTDPPKMPNTEPPSINAGFG